MRATKVLRLGACAALLALLPACDRDRDEGNEPRAARRNAERGNENGSSPRLPRVLSVDDGEALPNPSGANGATNPNSQNNSRTNDVARSRISNTSNNSGDRGDDQAIFILAGLAQEHDQFKKQLREMESKQAEFLPVQQEHAQQIKQISSIQVPKLEQQVAAQHLESAKLVQGQSALEQRVAALEDELRTLKQQKRTQPPEGAANPEGTPPVIEADPVPLEVPAATHLPAPVTAQAAKPSAQPQVKTPAQPAKVAASKIAAREEKKIAKYSVQQQAIRTKVRSIYERVVADFPGSQQAFDALMSLGAMAEEEEDWPVAIRLYEQAATEFTNRPEALNARFSLGRCLAAAGNYPQARESYLMIADNNPKHPLAMSSLLQAGIMLAKSGKLDAGIRELRHIEKTEPTSTFAQTAREEIVTLLFDNKRYDEVLACYPQVLESARPLHRMDLMLLKARAERRAKRYKDAKATLETMFAEKASPEVRAAGKYELADMLEEQNKLLDSARAFSDAAQEFPQHKRMPEARIKAAQLYLSSELPETATEQMNALLKGIAEWPKAELEEIEPEALFLLAKAQQNAGQIDAASKSLADLRKKYPDHPRSLTADLEEARGLAERGAVKDATALLRVLIRNHPDAPQTSQAMLLLADLQERNTDRLQRAQAYSDLLKATAGTEDESTNELRRGLLLMELERSAEAADVFQKIADSNRAKMDIRLVARYQAAVAQQQAGLLDAAVKSYTQFIDGSATPPEPAPKNLPALVEDAKWKVSKLKWLKELTAPTRATPAPAPTAPKASPAPVSAAKAPDA